MSVGIRDFATRGRAGETELRVRVEADVVSARHPLPLNGPERGPPPACNEGQDVPSALVGEWSGRLHRSHAGQDPLRLVPGTRRPSRLPRAREGAPRRRARSRHSSALALLGRALARSEADGARLGIQKARRARRAAEGRRPSADRRCTGPAQRVLAGAHADEASCHSKKSRQPRDRCAAHSTERRLARAEPRRSRRGAIPRRRCCTWAPSW